MAIFIIYFYALNLWASVLSHRIDSGALVLFILLPVLPCLVIIIWYIATNRATSSLCHRTQQLMRGSAGPDELLIRELENTNRTRADQDNSG
ncbi:hypothetical protein [Cellvibrio mixtus]|uniref:hypothetical protein n=1 Tax=Cellvibrio mixtus TaxID=39650 RepID=UPI00126A1B1A|nr:hypothetical protein [Cellvibrio mixtus]